MCGENLLPKHERNIFAGSPPRVRGKPTSIKPITGGIGITPACAGKTMSTPYTLSGARDHPRVCGENIFSNDEGKLPEGSPPRVRGKQSAENDKLELVGITPACAGKT